MKKFSTEDLTKMALLVSLISVSAYITIPLPFTPIVLTAQTLIVNLIGLLLLPRQAAFTILTYIFIGLIGIPVFSGGMGGPAKLFGPTGGYIFSYIPAVVLMSLLKGRKYSFIRYFSVAAIVGMPVIYLFGTVYMKFLTNMSWSAAFASAVLPFIPLDIFKCAAAAAIAKPVQIALAKTASWKYNKA